MKSSIALLTLVAAVTANPLPQGVTESIAPEESAPDGCQPSAPGTFNIQVVNVTSSAKVKRQLDGILTLTLQDGILKDQAGRTGYVAANDQFQFDAPPQTGAVYTSGFSLCADNSLAIGGSNIWWQCLSGGFYNLYSEKQGEQCNEIYIYAINGGGSGSGTAGASQMADGQPQVTQIADGQPQQATDAPAVTQIGDGQPQAPVSQIADGQPQAPVSQIADGQPQAPVSQIADGQPQAPVSQIADGQPQAPVSQIADGQPQAPVSQIADGQPQAPVSQIADGQPQAPVSQIADGQPQAPAVTQIADGQPQAPVSQISDGQPQAPAVTQIADGQPQAPTNAVSQISDGQPQAPTGVATFTGGAPLPTAGLSGLLMAGVVGAAALL